MDIGKNTSWIDQAQTILAPFGAAWSSLLGNSAAGIFLLVLRPCQVGDFLGVGGIEGTVLELYLFGTTITTPDNVKTIVGTGKIMGDDIKHLSSNPHRRVELVAQLAGSAVAHKAIALLRESVSALALRPYCHTNNYWRVYFGTNSAIAGTLGTVGFPVATQPVKIYPV